MAQKGDYTRLSLNLLETAEAQARDVRSIAEEFNETLQSKFAKGQKSKTNKKLPNSVSKAAVRNGAFYDLPSFGNRFTAVYPEYRAAFKENIDTYGEFLAEDFFKKYGTCYRLGSEEFCVIIDNPTLDFDELAKIFFIEYVKSNFKTQDLPLLSIGYAKISPKQDLYQVLSTADMKKLDFKKQRLNYLYSSPFSPKH